MKKYYTTEEKIAYYRKQIEFASRRIEALMNKETQEQKRSMSREEVLEMLREFKIEVLPEKKKGR